MSLKKYLVSGAAALAILGTAATAVTIEQDGTGDYLVAPAYYAVANWSTELKVVNTNTTHAVVAKVVIREANQSKEILDFPIYLTPGDVWVGTIYQDEDGIVKVKSTDDSLMLGIDRNESGDFVGPVLKGDEVDGGIVLPTYDKEGAIPTRGYVEVYGLAAYNADCLDDANCTNESFSEGCALDKKKMYVRVRDENKTTNLTTNCEASDVDSDALLGKQTIFAESDDVNGRRAMMLNMFAMGDAQQEPWVENVLGTDTVVPTALQTGVVTELAKSSIYVMYEGDGTEIYPMRTHFTAPFNANNLYSINEANMSFRDLSEDAQWCAKPACVQTGPEDTDPYADTSGRTESECPVHTYEEVGIIFNHDPAAGVSDPLLGQYGFNVGGYIDIKPEPSASVIPTTFYAKKLGDIYLNNHLYNQYKK